MLCSLAERLPVVHMHLQHLLLVCLAGAKEKQKKAAISSIRVGSQKHLISVCVLNRAPINIRDAEPGIIENSNAMNLGESSPSSHQ